MPVRKAFVLALLGTLAVPAAVLHADGPPPHALPVSRAFAPPQDGAAGCASAGGPFWVQADYLFCWLDSGHLPLVVTTSPPGTPAAQAGVEGVPGTRALFGDNGVGGDVRPGVLLRAGYGCWDGGRSGIEVGFLAMGRAGDRFTASSNGEPSLARPFFDVSANQPSAELIAAPGLQAGDVRVRTASDLVGTEVNYRGALCCLLGDDPDCRVDFLFGYRSLRYRDKVEIDQSVRSLDPARAIVRPRARDAFFSKSMFNGAQAGFAGRLQRESFWVEGRATAAIGQRDARLDITGSTAVALPGQPVTTARGGLLALPSNIGAYADQETAFVSEVGFKLGYQVGEYLSLTLGYTFLYFNSVIRSSEIIDRAVNPTQIPPGSLSGPANPAVVLQDNDIWAQGLSLGVEVRY